MQISVNPISSSPLFPKLNVSQADLQLRQKKIFGFGIDHDKSWSRQMAAFECAERTIGYHVETAITSLGGNFDVEMEFVPDVEFNAVVYSQYTAFLGGEKVMLPELLVMANERHKSINSVPSHGLALHSNFDNAIKHGESEWVERHAFFRAWYSDGVIFKDVDVDSILVKLSYEPNRDYSLYSYSLEQLGDHFSCVAVLQSKDGYMIGLGASTSRPMAIEKAIKEVALFHSYWLTYLEGAPVRDDYKTFNDHLHWFWLRGGNMIDLLDSRTNVDFRNSNISVIPRKLFFKVLWEGVIQGAHCTVVRTRIPGLIPQHSAGIVPLRAGNKLSIPPNSGLLRLNGIHPFS